MNRTISLTITDLGTHIITLYKLCAVRARMCSTSEDVQYESSRSSVSARMCSTNQAHHQYKGEYFYVYAYYLYTKNVRHCISHHGRRNRLINSH